MSHAELINKWPSLSDFADDIGVPYVTAKAMRRRGSVPAAYWTTMVSMAVRRSLEGVTLEEMARLSAELAGIVADAEDLQPREAAE